MTPTREQIADARTWLEDQRGVTVPRAVIKAALDIADTIALGNERRAKIPTPPAAAA